VPDTEDFQTFHLYTDEAINSDFVKRFVDRLKLCLNLEHPGEETGQDRYIDEWAEEAVCLVHANDTHRLILHCGINPIYNRYRK
jgi:rhamnogalacturonyl hydrolase YesR